MELSCSMPFATLGKGRNRKLTHYLIFKVEKPVPGEPGIRRYREIWRKPALR